MQCVYFLVSTFLPLSLSFSFLLLCLCPVCVYVRETVNAYFDAAVFQIDVMAYCILKFHYTEVSKLLLAF